MPDEESPAPTDTELIARVRGGDVEAYGQLWSRHFEAVRRVARRIAPRDDVDDLISESYTRVLTVLRAGQGPDTAFRAYLASTVRRVNIDQARRYGRRIVLTERDDALESDNAESTEEVAVRRSLSSTAWEAWRSLPYDTRELLWRLVVHEQTPAQLATDLGLTPNAVASRGKRARERLRQAYLSKLVSGNTPPECEQARTEFGAYVRGSLGPVPRSRIDGHLEHCDRCRGVVSELVSIDETIRVRIAPFLPLAPLVAAEHIAAGAVGSAGTAGAVGATGVGSAGGGSGAALGSAKLSVAHLPAGVTPLGLIGAACALATAVVVGTIAMGAQERPAPTAGPGYAAPSARRTDQPSVPNVTLRSPSTTVTAGAPRSTSSRGLQAVAPRSTPDHHPGRTSPATVQWSAPGPAVVTPALTPSTPPPPAPMAPTTPPVTPPPLPRSTVEPVPTSPGPLGPVTRLSLRPDTSAPLVAQLRAPDGWLITSVRDRIDGDPRERMAAPSQRFVGRLLPGPVDIEVTRTEPAIGAGSVSVRLVGWRGILPGSGTYALY